MIPYSHKSGYMSGVGWDKVARPSAGPTYDSPELRQRSLRLKLR